MQHAVLVNAKITLAGGAAAFDMHTAGGPHGPSVSCSDANIITGHHEYS